MKPSDPDVLLPPYILPESWEGFLESRAMMPKAMQLTPRGIKLALKKLAEFHSLGWDVNHILDESALQRWRGLFVNKDTKRRVFVQPTPEPPVLRAEDFDPAEREKISNRLRELTATLRMNAGLGPGERKH